MYIDKSIKEYLRVVQSGDPTPGGYAPLFQV